MPLRDIIGHEKAIELLKNLFSGGRTCNAFLFAGPEGIGKKLLAKELAKYVNCAEGKDDACGKCLSCERIEKEIHPDVEIIATDGDSRRTEAMKEYRKMQGNAKIDKKTLPSENIKIEQIREFQKNSCYRPFQGRYRALIVDDAEMMTEEAANCMLKILEEPPEYLIIILVTSKPYNMLPTIVSRCSRINFKSLNAKTVADILAVAGILKKRAPEAEKTIETLMFISGGSVGKAIEFYGNGAVENYNEIGINIRERRSIVYEKFAKRYGEGTERTGFLQKQRNIIRDLLYLSQIWKRNMLMNKFLGKRKEQSSENEELFREMSERHSVTDLINAIDRTEFLNECVDANVNPKIVLENINAEMVK